MSFKNTKSEVMEALRNKTFRHELRQGDQKNLLQTGEVTLEEALDLMARTRGDQASCSKHHFDTTIDVWVFRPQGWYIKFYLQGGCWFISFHPS